VSDETKQKIKQVQFRHFINSKKEKINEQRAKIKSRHVNKYREEKKEQNKGKLD